MDYRDDRDALRSRANDLELALADAATRANRAERELVETREALAGRDAEIGRLRGQTPPKPARAPIVAVVIGACVVLVGLCGAATVGVVFLRARSPAPPVEPTASVATAEVVIPSSPTSAPPAPKVAAPTSDSGTFQWGWGSQPSIVPMKLDDDDTEDFVGAYRIYSGELHLYVGGFDGESLKRTWSAGPFGTLSEGATSTWMTVVGERVLVTDFRARGHVLDAHTGRELSLIEFTDKARHACVATGGHGALVEVQNGKNVLVNLETFAIAPAPPAAKCPGAFGSGACAFARAPCVEATQHAPETRGELTFGSGKDAVTVGVKSPGTATPIAFAAGGRGWKTVIPEDPARAADSSHVGGSDLANGYFVTTYSLVGSGGRLVALDARTGDSRWEVAIPGSRDAPDGIVATNTRVYVPHWTKLNIFELNSGRLIGALGQ